MKSLRNCTNPEEIKKDMKRIMANFRLRKRNTKKVKSKRINPSPTLVKCGMMKSPIFE
jgi:hypothetical protein